MTEQAPLPHEGLTEAAEAEQRYKTLGVRLDQDLHAQLSFIAQLSGTTITEEIRRSIEARVVAAQDDAELVARADEVRQQIEREAEARRAAIAGFFGKAAVEEAVEQPTTPARGRRGKPAADADSQ